MRLSRHHAQVIAEAVETDPEQIARFKARFPSAEQFRVPHLAVVEDVQAAGASDDADEG